MKKLFFAAVCVLAGWAVHAEAMYWQLNGSSIQGVTGDQWSMAQIEVYQNGAGIGTYLHYVDDATIDVLDKESPGAWFDVTAYKNGDPEYSFVLELVNDSLEVVAASNPISYSTLESNGRIVSESAFNSITPVNYSTYNVGTMSGTGIDVPEPTSGLLMLLGASLLALRRRPA